MIKPVAYHEAQNRFAFWKLCVDLFCANFNVNFKAGCI